MAALKETLGTINDWLKTIIDLGLKVILALIVIEILFPDFPAGVIKNLTAIVGSFAENGVVGLIALLIFLLIYKK